MKTIVLIEDNESVRLNTAEILELAGYEVYAGENGKIGVELAQKHKPDIILCDIMMPVMDGYEVLQALNKETTTAGIPFIFLTAKTSRSQMRMGMNLGADDYLTKPFEENELLDAISCRLRKNDFLKKEISKNLTGIHEFLEDAAEYMDLKSLSQDYRTKHIEKGQIIFWEGDGAHSLFFVESGTVKTHKSTEAGKEFVTGIYGDGSFIGQLSLLNKGGTYIETATVLADAEICEIPKEDFTKLLYGNHVVAQKFIKMISNDMIDVQDHLVDMAYASVRQRAARSLLELHDKGLVGDPANSGVGIPREDFAGLIGTATETAIRTLSEFKEEGLITTDYGRRIVVLNQEELKHVADFK